MSALNKALPPGLRVLKANSLLAVLGNIDILDALDELCSIRQRQVNYVRYCPECNLIGEVPEGALNCCPCGDKAMKVSPEIAKLAYLGFRELCPLD